MANVKGNYKGGKAIVKYSRTTAIKAKGIQAAGQIARNYKRYVSPSVKILKGATGLAAGAAKIALRFPGTGLALTAGYLGAKHLGKKWGRGYHYSAVRQFDKKGRKII